MKLINAGIEIITLFEKYAKRLLTGKVRPSLSEEGIMTIPNNQRVQKMAQSLYDDFQKAGVPDDILKTENDIKVFHSKIAEINNENIDRQFKTLMGESTFFNPKKSAQVFNLKGKKMDPTKPIIGGENIGKIDLPEIPKPSVVKETEEQILARLQRGNKESLSNMRYEKAVKAEEAKAAADENYIMEVFDPEDFSDGGRAGYYGGGITNMVGEDLSEIGHGAEALMARNMQLAPNGQATTSKGLNYLLGQDNDTVRVPYNEGNMVLPKAKPREEFLLEQVISPAGIKTLDPKTRQMFIEELKKKIRDKKSIGEKKYQFEELRDQGAQDTYYDKREKELDIKYNPQNYPPSMRKFASGGVAGLLGEGPSSMDQEPRTNYQEAGVVDKIGGMVNYKNVPHYLAKPLKGVTNVAEFVGKLPFAATELASDMIQKPLFKAGDKVPGLPGVGAKFVGGEMFKKFGDSLDVGGLAEKLGLASLAENTGKNLTPEARTIGDLLESGGEFANAGGILSAGKKLFKGGDSLKKLSQSMGKVKENKTLEKLVDETLTARGEGRRDFNKLVASGGVMVALQSIGLGGIKAAKTKSTPDAVLTLKTLIDDADEMTENGLMAVGRQSSSIDVSGLTDAVKKSLAVIMKNSRTKFGDKVVRNKVKGKDGKFTDDYEDISTEEAAYIMEELQKKGHNVKLEHYDDMGGQGVDDLLNKFKNKDETYGKNNYDKFSKKVAKMTDKEKLAYHSSITDDYGNYYDEFVEELLDMNFKNSTK